MAFAVLLLTVSSVASAATPIEFWTTEVSADRQAVISYLVKAFNISNPDVEVRVVGVDENSIVDALVKARADGGGPDVISCASDLIVAFDTHGWMSTRGAKRIISDVGERRFYSGALCKLHMANGDYCGIPFNGWVQGIWYRKDWFDLHDLAPPDSWDRIMKAAKTLHSPKNGRYGILIGTRNDTYAEQVFTHLALSAGVKEFSPDGRVVFDSPAAVKTLKFYSELAQYTPPGPQWWRGRDYYLQGRLAMMFYSTFIMDDLAIPSVAAGSLTGEQFEELKGAAYDAELLGNTGMVSSITGTQKAGYGVIHALGLLQGNDAEKRTAAERFVRFLFTPDAYVTWLHMVPGGMMPVLRDISGNEMFFRDAQGVFQKFSRQRVEGIVSGFESLKSFSFADGVLSPQAAQVTSEGVIPEMIINTLDGGMTSEEAVASAAERMRKIAAQQSH